MDWVNISMPSSDSKSNELIQKSAVSVDVHQILTHPFTGDAALVALCSLESALLSLPTPTPTSAPQTKSSQQAPPAESAPAHPRGTPPQRVVRLWHVSDTNTTMAARQLIDHLPHHLSHLVVLSPYQPRYQHQHQYQLAAGKPGDNNRSGHPDMASTTAAGGSTVMPEWVDRWAGSDSAPDDAFIADVLRLGILTT